jgi:hypothetical protein
MKQQSENKHVAPLRHIILIPNQPAIALPPLLEDKKQVPIS